MKKQLQCGCILSPIFKDLLYSEIFEKLKRISYFDIEYEFPLAPCGDSIFAVCDNYLSRGLPTFASLYVEEMISSKFGISIKTENQKTGEIFFDVTPEFEKYRNPIEKIFQLDLSKYLINNPIFLDRIGLNALQIALIPFAVARIEKSILFLMMNGILDSKAEAWNIAIIERDVPCGGLAIEDLKKIFHNLFLLESKKRKLPPINLSLFNSVEFASNNLNVQSAAIPIGKFNYQNKYDAIIDISILTSSGLDLNEIKENRFDNNCKYLKIRSSNEITSQRIINSRNPIKYSIPNSEQQPALLFFLRNIFRKNNFREGQIKILRKTLSLENVIALLPTGAGKSLTYQLSAILQPGIVMVIDPIKSLMLDQYQNLIATGIDSTAFINSSLNKVEIDKRSQEMQQGFYQFIFVSPERLQIQEFRDYLQNMNETTFTYCVIDEAHCVSEWGHDFRTAYLRIGENVSKYCRSLGKELPIIGLTGTASFDVLADVQRELNIKEKSSIISPEKFQRDELKFRIFNIDNIPNCDPNQIKYKVAEAKNIKLKEIINQLPHQQWNSDVPYRNYRDFFNQERKYKNSGIVFCPHVSWIFGVEDVAKKIKENIKPIANLVDVYAGSKLVNVNMDEVQNRFKKDQSALLVATKAFGMGIDKPNIRFTIHFSMPQSIESFYQEAGRAGRDKDPAYCYILYSSAQVTGSDGKPISIDKNFMLSFFHNSFPGVDKEKRILLELLDEIIGDNGSKQDGIERVLANLNISKSISVKIPFTNNLIKEITKYLNGLPSKHFWTKKEVKEIYQFCFTPEEFINKIQNGKHKTILLDSHKVDLEKLFQKVRGEQETHRAIYRLSIIGIVDDYIVDYAKETINVSIIKRADQDYIQKLTDYIGRYESPRITERVPEEIQQRKGASIIRKCCGYLINFVYNKIAAKREEAINVMEQAIRSGYETGKFDEYVNTYFDSKFTGTFRQKTKNKSMDWAFEFLEKLELNHELDRDAINHIRGACDRLLVENPDNAALLLLRAFAKLLNPDYEQADGISDFRRGSILIKEIAPKKYLDYFKSYYDIAANYDQNVRNYLDLEILNEHLGWLKSFNQKYLEDGINA